MSPLASAGAALIILTPLLAGRALGSCGEDPLPPIVDADCSGRLRRLSRRLLLGAALMRARPRRTGPVLTDAAREAFAAALVILLAIAFAGAALERAGPAQPLPDQYRIR